MGTADPRRRARENLTGIVSMLVTGIWLAALLTDQEWWLAFMLFGYVVIVPIVALLFGDEDEVSEWWDESPQTRRSERADERTEAERTEEATEDGNDEALARLRERYANGELTDEQFERKVERLLETETIEDLEDRRGRSAERSSGTDGNRDRDRDRDPEPEHSR